RITPQERLHTRGIAEAVTHVARAKTADHFGLAIDSDDRCELCASLEQRCWNARAYVNDFRRRRLLQQGDDARDHVADVNPVPHLPAVFIKLRGDAGSNPAGQLDDDGSLTVVQPQALSVNGGKTQDRYRAMREAAKAQLLHVLGSAIGFKRTRAGRLRNRQPGTGSAALAADHFETRVLKVLHAPLSILVMAALAAAIRIVGAVDAEAAAESKMAQAGPVACRRHQPGGPTGIGLDNLGRLARRPGDAAQSGEMDYRFDIGEPSVRFPMPQVRETVVHVGSKVVGSPMVDAGIEAIHRDHIRVLRP